MKKTALIIGVFALLAVASGCKKQPGPFGKGSIAGVVTCASCTTVEGVIVEIWYDATSADGESNAMRLADSGGKFSFAEMSKGDYYITAAATDTLGVAVTGNVTVNIKKKKDEAAADIAL